MMSINIRNRCVDYSCPSIRAHDAGVNIRPAPRRLGVIRAALLLAAILLANVARAETVTIDPNVMKALHIGVRPVAQPTLLDQITGTAPYLHSRPAAKPLTITDLDKPHTSGLKYVGSGGWSTQ
jgi:hypothetical protein